MHCDVDARQRELGLSRLEGESRATEPHPFAVLSDQVRFFGSPLLISLLGAATRANLHRTLDPTRPINDNCGWEHVQPDLTTFHDYADGPELTKTCSSLAGILGPKAGRDMFMAPLGSDPGAQHRANAPVICTECGGVNIRPKGGGDGDENGRDQEWGYTTASDGSDLLKRIEKLMRGVVNGGICCGFVWTQL